MRKCIALLMICAMALALVACGKSAAVKETERLIGDIGEVTVDSAQAVEAAEAAYEALSDKDREKVENYETLTAAREALEAAKKEALRLSVVGSWQVDMDVRDALVEEIDAQFGGIEASFGDYLEHFELSMYLDLKEDGTYHLWMDQERMTGAVDGFREAIKPFIRDFLQYYIAQALTDSGIEGDFSTLEGLEKAIGMELDEAIEQSLGMSLEDYVDTLMADIDLDSAFGDADREGQYKVEPGKLYISDALDHEPDDSHAVDFTVENETLTLKLDAQDELFGMDELVFTKR